MNRLQFFSLLSLLLFSPLSVSAEPINILVSILPLKHFVEVIGGEKVNVSVIVRPGQNPENYTPAPQDVIQISRSQIYFQMNLTFEQIFNQTLKQTHPNLKTVNVTESINALPQNTIQAEQQNLGSQHPTEQTHHQAHQHDLHVWTDPILVRDITLRIRNNLIQIDPSHRYQYKKNYEAFSKKLEQLDQDIQKLFRNKTSKTFLVFHPAWGYFAKRYGLTQVAIEKNGKEPSAKDLAQLTGWAKQAKLNTLFVQPQFHQKSAFVIAQILSAKIITLDPLAENYIPNTYQVAIKLANSMPE